MDGRITADYVEALKISVGAAQITGTLTIGQLPDSVAETSDIPTKVSELSNDSGYQNASGVVSIVDGRITADYVEGLSCEFASGKIGGWTISSNEIWNGSAGINAGGSYTKDSLVSSGTSAVRFYAGNGNRTGGKFVVLDDGSLYAEAAKITGHITATSGSFSGTITSASATITGGSLKIGSNSTYVNIDSSGVITIDGSWSAYEVNQTMLLMKFHSIFGDLCGLYVSGYVDEDMKFTPTNVFAKRIG